MDEYNIVWTTPSNDSSGSMPLGNGDIGLNVWVEPNGDICFYVGKTDAWDGLGRLIKLGKARVSFLPNPLRSGHEFTFKQTLSLMSGCIVVDMAHSASSWRLSASLWVDAHSNTVRMTAECSESYEMRVAFEPWRLSERILTGQEVHSAYGLVGWGRPIVSHPDVVVPQRQTSIAWYHRNEDSIWSTLMEHQGLGAIVTEQADPLLHRTFGGIISGDDLVNLSPVLLASTAPRRHSSVSIVLHTGVYENAEEWLEDAELLLAGALEADVNKSWSEHMRWWEEFWGRSWIRISGSEEGKFVSRAYALQRYVNACGGRGAYPIKFNGSIFTVDGVDNNECFDADYRRWGGPYWFQNTRLTYWPMLASGDFDLMQSFFKMYVSNLPVATLRSMVFFGHEGACFPETMFFWGSMAGDNYGWDRNGKPIHHIDNPWIRHHWSGALELLAIGYDYYAFTQDGNFASESLLPLADGVLTWYDRHYRRDEDSIIVFSPAAALETQDAIDPMPEIAGLRYVLPRLLSLPDALVGSERRMKWEQLLEELPSLPLNNESLLDAAVLLGEVRNSENPSLYAIFPFRLFGVGKPDIEVALRSFHRRRVRGNEGWRQDPIQAAYLGLADEAQEMVVERARNKHEGSRFPAFWGPNFDWIPDQDHGNVMVMALQAMLLQSDYGINVIFPAWPKDWDVEFKLRAPYGVVIEGSFKEGRLERLVVDPPEAASSIEVRGQQ